MTEFVEQQEHKDSKHYITLGQAVKISPGRPSSNAIWRWCRKGVKSRSGQRIKLDHIRAGGKIFTTPEALDRFFAAVAEGDAEYFDRPGDTFSQPKGLGLANRSVSETQRQRSIRQTEKLLDQAGI